MDCPDRRCHAVARGLSAVVLVLGPGKQLFVAPRRQRQPAPHQMGACQKLERFDVFADRHRRLLERLGEQDMLKSRAYRQFGAPLHPHAHDRRRKVRQQQILRVFRVPQAVVSKSL